MCKIHKWKWSNAVRWKRKFRLTLDQVRLCKFFAHFRCPWKDLHQTLGPLQRSLALFLNTAATRLGPAWLLLLRGRNSTSVCVDHAGSARGWRGRRVEIKPRQHSYPARRSLFPSFLRNQIWALACFWPPRPQLREKERGGRRCVSRLLPPCCLWCGWRWKRWWWW